ncbi:MAG: 1-acyl-sn-glycerol-3-phosphate acyltransferase [Flavobacteriales bacterium]|nr:MAG: 1-acyl-sn-glycerol-3-phosphate acyltransferase [Flavobacteriales bacterium]
MVKVLNYIWRGWFMFLATVLTLIFALPVYIFSLQKNGYKKAYFFIRLWSYGLFYGMGFRYELINLTEQRLNKNEQYIVIANHTSIMDIMLSCILLPHHSVCFVGKKELDRIPIFGVAYRKACILVDRKCPKSRSQVYAKCAERMDEGNSIILYPEGGVPNDTSIVLDEFKNGAFAMSCKHQKKIAVFTFVGLKEFFPFDHGKGKMGKVKVFFNGILEPEADFNHQKNKAREMILNQLSN